MRSIFPRLFLSFSLTFLVAGLLSGLVVYSFSRRSVETFRDDFRQRLHANIARSVALMGQAAYVMRKHRGDQALADYVDEVESSMRTRLYLRVDGMIVPATDDPTVARLMTEIDRDKQPIIAAEEGKLLVAQNLRTPEGQPYVVIGLHMLGPPAGMPGPRPPPGRFAAGPPPPFEEEGFLRFLGRLLGVRFFVFLPLAAIICYLLARSFSAPLDRLRRVSRLIAEGDLSARVGANLGKPGNEIGDLGRDFDLMAERMEGLVNAQKRLLLDISHELRSPLTRLNLSLELAKKRTSDDDGNLARIGREANRLNALIGQLLTLNRGGVTAVDDEAVPLVDLLDEIGRDVDFEYHDRDKGIRLDTLEPLVVTGCREQLRQAIENILRNGAHYTRPSTRVEVGLSSRPGESGGRQAVIRVRDHGPGVPEDKLLHLTEPFFRVAAARDRNSGGVGLGLAIARQVIEQHGGSLYFTNAPDDGGLVVDILLPVREERFVDVDPENPD